MRVAPNTGEQAMGVSSRVSSSVLGGGEARRVRRTNAARISVAVGRLEAQVLRKGPSSVLASRTAE